MENKLGIEEKIRIHSRCKDILKEIEKLAIHQERINRFTTNGFAPRDVYVSTNIYGNSQPDGEVSFKIPKTISKYFFSVLNGMILERSHDLKKEISQLEQKL